MTNLVDRENFEILYKIGILNISPNLETFGSMDVLCASSQMEMFERSAPFAPSRLIGAVADDPLLSSLA